MGAQNGQGGQYGATQRPAVGGMGTPTGMRSAFPGAATYANQGGELPRIGTSASPPYMPSPIVKMPPVVPVDGFGQTPQPAAPWAPPPGQVVGGSETQQGTWQPGRMPPIVPPMGDTGPSAAVTPSAPGGYSDAGGLFSAGGPDPMPGAPMTGGVKPAPGVARQGAGRIKGPRMDHSTPTPTFEMRDPQAWARMQQMQAHNDAWTQWLGAQGLKDPGVGMGGDLLKQFYAANPQWAPKVTGPNQVGGFQG